MNYNLTPEQRKAAIKVKKAIEAAGKLGVGFWDDYGAITAFNSNKIAGCPEPVDFYDEPLNPDYVERMFDIKNWYGSNADDPLFVKFK